MPSDKPLAQKLMIKAGRTVRVLNAPAGYLEALGPAPEGAVLLPGPDRPADIVQVFTRSRAELEEWLPRLKDQVAPQGMIWVTYPKGTSKQKTDINRDSINAYAHTLGMEGVAMVAIDATWSALRLKIAA